MIKIISNQHSKDNTFSFCKKIYLDIKRFRYAKIRNYFKYFIKLILH